MMHPDTELRRVDDEIGFGVFATRALPRGTIVWAHDPLDRCITPDGLRELPAPVARQLDRYTFRNRDGEHVLCWDLGRFVNHSCRPNVMSTGWDFDVAVRDVPAGTELTNDYGTLNLEWVLDCRCGETGCRGRVAACDFERVAPAIDDAVRAALRALPRVAQPLFELLADREAVLAAATGRRESPSVLAHRFVGAGPGHVDAAADSGRRPVPGEARRTATAAR